LKLQANDMIQFRLFANDGFKMIDLVIVTTAAREASFLQRPHVPVLHRERWHGQTATASAARNRRLHPARGRGIDAGGLQYTGSTTETIRTTPSWSNRRVVVFPGGGGDARSVVPLENNNTTCWKCWPRPVGQWPSAAMRSKVKVFRYGPDGKRLVYQFDLSDHRWTEVCRHGDAGR
jgi:hypothetical protein